MIILCDLDLFTILFLKYCVNIKFIHTNLIYCDLNELYCYLIRFVTYLYFYKENFTNQHMCIIFCYYSKAIFGR